jgi:diacylglycerol kinase family enzyme
VTRSGRPHILVVENPVASGVTPASERIVMDALRPYAEIDVARTERPLHARDLAHQAVEDGLDAVIVFAGDGTANEVLNGVAGRLPVGALPAGGTSVLPRAAGLPRRLEPAARQIAEALAAGRVQRLPLGVLNGRRFAFNAGVGLDADIVRRVDARGRGKGRRPRDVVFALEVTRAVASGRYGAARATLHHGDDALRCAFVAAANLNPWSYVGPLALRLAPKAANDLGLDLIAPVALRRRDVPAYLRYVLFTGGHAQGTERRIAYLHDVSEAVVDCDRPLPAQVDGDDIGDVRTATFGVEPDGMLLLV